MEKGMLLEHILTDLKVPHSYEVRLTPLTRFGAGDMAARTIRYLEPLSSPNPIDNICHFEDEKICGYTQDTTDNFDWIRQSSLTYDPKRTANTGPTVDLSGTQEARCIDLGRGSSQGRSTFKSHKEDLEEGKEPLHLDFAKPSPRLV
uniref:MAM domain-containing glycosylphosphatidylinositol anchor protein 1 n=1 Tax=Sphaerodactylus townsendi TaxID=933632 RepID=A0ACB8GAT1_9SAUR